jgi:phospholipase/lecithinase/hemolysin
MKNIRSAVLAVLASIALMACGGGGDDEGQARYSRLVVFGDSLSDVGTHATPGLKAAFGDSGKYTVNSPGVNIWVERLALLIGVGKPCAAQTGLEASGPFASIAAPITNKPGCFDYAQGGSRVTNPVGPYNKALLALGNTDGYVGQITDPLVNQFQRHLTAIGGTYTGDELVTVLAGGNDVFMNLAQLQATIGAGGDATAAATAAVTAMGTAGAELAGYVKNLVLAKGAKHVVVVNLPDISKTPFGLSKDVATQGLILQMNAAFNGQLAAGLNGTTGVLQVDAFTRSQDQAALPSKYFLSNVTMPACDLAKALSSLTCNANTLIPGDVSRYLYADTVHPTPYGYQLLSDLVVDRLLGALWL